MNNKKGRTKDTDNKKMNRKKDQTPSFPSFVAEPMAMLLFIALLFVWRNDSTATAFILRSSSVSFKSKTIRSHDRNNINRIIHSKVRRNIKSPLSSLQMASDDLSMFARSLEEARKRMGLPEHLLSASKDSTAFTDLARKQTSSANSNNAAQSSSEEISKTPKPTSSYQRIEDWEAERKAKARATMSWEERVQFDGQRYGDQYRQNEILRKNLY